MNEHHGSILAGQKLVLLVEDDEVHASLLYQIIQQETPHQICFTRDGETAWKLLQRIKPHLLILDYLLPGGLNGLELYDRLQTCHCLKDLPVLLVSAAMPLQEVRRRGLPYVLKPFELDDLLSTIEQLLMS